MLCNTLYYRFTVILLLCGFRLDRGMLDKILYGVDNTDMPQ